MLAIQGCVANSENDPARFDNLQKKYESMSCSEIKAEILSTDAKLNSAYKGKEPGMNDVINPLNYIPGVLNGQKMFNDKKSKELNNKLTILNALYQKKKCVSSLQ